MSQEEEPLPWPPPPERCDIRTCALPATRRYWHSHVTTSGPVEPFPGPAA